MRAWLISIGLMLAAVNAGGETVEFCLDGEFDLQLFTQTRPHPRSEILELFEGIRRVFF